MRGKRSKQYRKLMQQYGLTFGFREPYQVLGMHPSHLPKPSTLAYGTFLVDAQMIQDTNRFSMDLVAGLERTLHGKVKPSTLLLHLYRLHSRRFFDSFR